MIGLTSLATGRGTFPRGVHPPEGKDLAQDRAIEVMPTPGEVMIPLLQHVGAPCEGTVKPRTEVAVGDELGTSGAFVSAPVHASISGKTGRTGAVTLPNGRHVAVIPIKAEGAQPLEGKALFDDLYGGEWPTEGLDRHDPKAIVDACRKAGLVGQGGAAFPAHVKLTRNEKKPIDLILINGCECEPYLTADYRLMLEAPAPIVAGAILARHAAGAREAVVCVEDNKPRAIEALRKAVQGTQVAVRVMKTKYPQGGEKQLIYAATGREVPGGGLPLDIGVVVLNVGTAAALARAVLRGKPLTHRVVTVTGSGVKNPKNLLVPIGTSFRDLIRCCGGLTDDARRIVAGGPMMGFSVSDPDTPVTKGTSGITVLSGKELEKSEETNCVRCGRCVDVCPMRLVPTKLGLAARSNLPELAVHYHVMSCMECGCCAYVCPGRLPLVQLIRIAKIQIRSLPAPDSKK